MIPDKTAIADALARAKRTGADFSELYFEDTVSQSLGLVSSSIEDAVSARNIGVGIRLLKDKRCVYAYGNDVSPSGLLALADSAAAALSGSAKIQDIVLTPAYVPRMNPIVIPCHKGDIRRKADLLRRADAAARAKSPEIAQVNAAVREQYKTVIIANSEGLYAQD